MLDQVRMCCQVWYVGFVPPEALASCLRGFLQRNTYAFLDDDGSPFLEGSDDADTANISPSVPGSSTISLGRTMTGSFASLLSVDSIASRFFRKDDPKNMRERLTIHLPRFCDIITRHKSLSAAEILSVECYKERTNFGVLHRFLIFHLRRPQRADVWLRVDRRRDANSSLLQTALARGRTLANDTVRHLKISDLCHARPTVPI
jgi:hypothetical protein